MEQGHKSPSCIMEDYCDGRSFSSHPLFSAQRDALQIFLYFDELEVANPIGSKAKIHKLGMYSIVGCTVAKHCTHVRVNR